MNHDVRKLQILNDLIAQSLDLINQRATMLGGGLSHTPYGYDPRLNGGVGIAPSIDPRFIGSAPAQTMPMWNTGIGLSHTPYAFDPRVNVGFGATGVDPRFIPSPMPTLPTWGAMGLSHTPYAYDPRVNVGFGATGIDPRFVAPTAAVPFLPQWNAPVGLNHSPYDPRWNVGQGLPYGADPRFGLPVTGFGYPYAW